MQIFQTMEKQTLRNQNITSWCVLNIYMCHICKNDQPIPRHMDQKARMKYRKDCDEVFPGIIVGNGECIKDVRYLSPPFSFFLSSIAVHFNDRSAAIISHPFKPFFICFLWIEISHSLVSIMVDDKQKLLLPSLTTCSTLGWLTLSTALSRWISESGQCWCWCWCWCWQTSIK